MEWIKVFGIHALFESFLVPANLMTAIMATSTANKAKSSGLTTVQSKLMKVVIFSWLVFLLALTMAIIMFGVAPFQNWARRFGEYLVLAVVLIQTMLFLYTTVVAFEAYSALKSSGSAHTALMLGLLSILSFLIAGGYSVYIILSLIHKKNISSYGSTSHNHSGSIAFSTPEITVLKGANVATAKTVPAATGLPTVTVAPTVSNKPAPSTASLSGNI